MNEILTEMHNFRHSLHSGGGSLHSNSISSLPKRILAQSMPLDSDILSNAVLKELLQEMNISQDVYLGKKHFLEMVKVETLDNFQKQVQQRMQELSNDIADQILANCLVDLGAFCVQQN